MTTKYGIIKLVDREEFAYANFNNGRFKSQLPLNCIISKNY